MPLFVKSGSFVPVGPAIQYTSEKLDGPITFYVYRGADGSFDLYEDDGLTYGYEKGAFTRIPVHYDDADGSVTIGARSGRFPGMVEKRTFNVRWIEPGETNASAFDSPIDASVEYAGQSVTLRPPG